VVVEADGLDVEVPGRVLVREAGFTLERGQRMALVGPNGAGKTTLLETLIGRRPPARGRVSVGHRVAAAYFSQQGEELRSDRTVLETVLVGSDLTQAQARTLLGGFLFPGDAVDAPVERLSGGERRRLALVALIARGGNLLVLDEPTNHLDTESREALEAALEAYDGTVLLVTHDRALIDAVATHTLAIEDGRAVVRPGGYADLVRARESSAAPEPQLKAPAPRAERRPRRERPRREPRHLERQVRRLEGEIARVEASIADVEAMLGDPGTLGDREAVAARGEEHRTLQEELAWLLREWERVAEAAG
jgi:ATP-binding cassette subfamily F protein 3